MIGQVSAVAWLETAWLLAQFGEHRSGVQVGYAAFVAQGVGQSSSLWWGLRNQVFLVSDAFVKCHCVPPRQRERLREVPPRE